MTDFGAFVWFDLMTPSPDAAAAFYTRIVDWGVQTVHEPMTYSMWTAQGVPLGGLMTLPAEAGAPPHWLGYVNVSDIAEKTALVAELGGKVLRPVHVVPNTGAFSVVTDPQGAAFALFEPTQQEPPKLARNAPGRMSWAELNTTDYESAWRFYSKLLGWKATTSVNMGDHVGTYFMFDREGGDGTSMGGMSNVATAMGVPAHWLFYANVQDIGAALKRVSEHGGRVMNGPMDVPGGGTIAQCVDPQGAYFALFAG